jgi:protein-disulfide isomerase
LNSPSSPAQPSTSQSLLPPRRVRRTFWIASGLISTLGLGVGLATASSTGQGHLEDAGFVRAPQALPAPVKSYGSKSAPITIEVFSDYECPMCRTLYEQTLRPMISDYVSAGKVYLVHHDFPLGMHKDSGQASRWANAAAQIGQFEPVAAALFDNQSAWEVSSDIPKYVAAALPSADFKRLEKIMEPCVPPGPSDKPGGGVNVPPHPCSVDPYIEQDIELGNKVPVTGTPTYLITYKGQRLPPGSGFVSWPVLKQFLDNLLTQ